MSKEKQWSSWVGMGFYFPMKEGERDGRYNGYWFGDGGYLFNGCILYFLRDVFALGEN